MVLLISLVLLELRWSYNAQMDIHLIQLFNWNVCPMGIGQVQWILVEVSTLKINNDAVEMIPLMTGVTCPSPSIDPQVVVMGNVFYAGDRTFYTCQRNNRPSNDQVLTCLPNGEWDHMPHCTMV
jgi:hypothetical protein